MAVRKTLSNSAIAVKLTRIEELSASHRVMTTHHRLMTLRPDKPRILANPIATERAFASEVAASKLDPTAMRLAAAGY